MREDVPPLLFLQGAMTVSSIPGAFRKTTFLLLALGVGLAGSAYAQEPQPKPRRTLLQILFGVQPKQPDVIKVPIKKKPRRTGNSITTLSTKADAVAKNPNAHRVLVIGDFLAAGLAEGLQDAFSQDAGTIIEARANTASGLVRDDYFNWPEKLSTHMDNVRPAALVVMVGANDRQQIRNGDTKLKVGAPEWNSAYTARVSGLIKVAADHKTPLLWVGLPSFKAANTSAAATQFNTIYRAEVARAQGEFVDIWDGFVDETGKFVVTGSDINGLPVRLRTSDGINMTAAGKRKMAFYAEKPLRKMLGELVAPDGLARLNSDGMLASPQTGADVAKAIAAGPVLRTPPISLVDPALDGGAALLGGTAGKASASPAAFVFPLDDAPSGRVDNFSRPAR